MAMDRALAGGRPVVALVVGLTGSGKTTLARNLASARGVLRFSIDEWMRDLFWKDAPSPSSLDWALERCARCETVIARLLEQEIARGRGAVLDLGFSTVAERAAWMQRLRTLRAEPELIWLDVPAAERWRRVEARNARIVSDPSSVVVDRETFDWMERYFEPLTQDELAAARTLSD